MAYNFRPYDPHQRYLFPPSLSEWVSDGSLARCIGDAVDILSSGPAFQAMLRSYNGNGEGAASYHPDLLRSQYKRRDEALSCASSPN